MASRVKYPNIIKKTPWHANMTELNHLGAALLAKPDVFEPTVRKSFAAMDYDNAPFFYKLSSEGRERKVKGNEWTWPLRGASRRPLVSMGNPNTDNETPGKFNREFQLKLDENWYQPGDVLTPGDQNKRLQVRVQSGPMSVGSGHLYRVVMNTGDPALYMPAKYFEAGQQWSKLNSQYEEGAEQAGSTHYALPIELKSRLSRFRKKYRITGDAHDQVLSVAVPDSNGKYHKFWMKYAEAEYWMQWYQELEAGVWYNRDNGGKVTGSTGRKVLTGPGVQQLLEGGNQETYNKLTGKLLQDFMLSIFFGRVRPDSGNRKLIGYAGEIGMINFHTAVNEVSAKSPFIQVVDNKFVKSTSSPYSSNALSFGYQYVTYKMVNGMELELRHNPIYDNTQYNREIDERTGYPKESSRITFFDMSGEGEESNIKLVKKEDAFSHSYVEGTVGPYGRGRNRKAAHEGDYYDVVVQDQCGVQIDDVTRTGELILN